MNKRIFLLLFAICGLILIFLVTVLYAWDHITFRNFKIILLAGTIIWFTGILVASNLRNNKNYSLLLAVSALVFSGCTGQQTENEVKVWPVEKAWVWSEKTGWLSGCNFQPSTASNQLEMWQEDTFDPQTIDRELGWAEQLGFNVMRVYLHSYAWKQDPEGFIERMEEYLTVSRRHGIRTIFVFFDDCWNENSKPGPQPEPEAGIHNSRWIQDPSCDLRADTISLYPWLEEYVKDVMHTFRDDARIIMWDLYNEPGNMGHLVTSMPLLKNVFKWAREEGPSQPVTSGIWNLDLQELNEFQVKNSDIITYHNYMNREFHRTWIRLLKMHGRPLICTEYLARQLKSTFEDILPLLKEENVGAINWGLVAGRTNTIYAWNTPMPQGGEPDTWFCNIFRKDGTAYSTEEIKIIKQINGID